MINLNPAETFPIARIISNHLDTNTYYVRAVIKNATTDATLATVDLADKGNRYFRTNWKVVWDNTLSRGRFITITTSVYTDSGYTTKSNDYGDEIQTYLIQERWDPYKVSGGGIDYSELRKIVKEELKPLDTESLAKEITESFPEQNDLAKVETAIEKAANSIDSLSKEFPNKLTDECKHLSQEIKARPKFEKSDLSKRDLTKMENELSTGLSSLTKDFKEFKSIVENQVEEIRKSINKKMNLNIAVNGQEVLNNDESRINKLKAKYNI